MKNMVNSNDRAISPISAGRGKGTGTIFTSAGASCFAQHFHPGFTKAEMNNPLTLTLTLSINGFTNGESMLLGAILIEWN
jgi:hypothetical protein